MNKTSKTLSQLFRIPLDELQHREETLRLYAISKGVEPEMVTLLEQTASIYALRYIDKRIKNFNNKKH